MSKSNLKQQFDQINQSLNSKRESADTPAHELVASEFKRLWKSPVTKTVVFLGAAVGGLYLSSLVMNMGTKAVVSFRKLQGAWREKGR